jgi:hypothetical protein
MKQDDDTDREEISDDNSDDAGDSTLSSDIQEDILDNQQEVLHLDQACHDKIIRTTRVPWAMKRNFADSVFARTSLPNLRHPPWAMAPPLQECKKPTIDILRKSDSVTDQALPVPKAGGDRSVL